MSRHRTLSVRTVAVALAVAQATLAIPVSARGSGTPGSAERRLTAAPLPAPEVTVNRTVPAVTPPAAAPVFSDKPTIEEVFRARVFGEPLVPVGRTPGNEETTALASAMQAFHRGGGGNLPIFDSFLAAHPESPWRASLLANIGVVEARSHAYTRAFEALEGAWQLAKDSTEPRGKAVADFAVAEWLELTVSFGQLAAVESRLREIQARPIGGSAGVKIARARENLAVIKTYPHLARWCGPEALMAFLAVRDPKARIPRALADYKGSSDGMSLAQLEALARSAGLRMRGMRTTRGDVVPVPSIAHLKVNHYVTVVEAKGGRYRVIDRTRGQEYWIDRPQFVAESSGYFLVDERGEMSGLKKVAAAEAQRVRGSGPVCQDGAPPPNAPCKKGECCPGGGGPPPPPPPPGSPGGGCGGGSCRMTTYMLQPVTASLLLHDTPVGYSPSRGPAVPLAFGYHHREGLQPQIFTMANVGPKWTFTWLRYVQEVPIGALGTAPAHVWVYLPPGGREGYTAPDAFGVYQAHWSSRAALARTSTSPLRYERRLPDGSVEIYGQADGAPAGTQRVFLTEVRDPLGQSLTLTWDAQFRLVAIADALGQVSTIAYSDADPLKITSVTDPFDRTATLTYNAAGQLETITDVLGIVSRFTYGANDFVTTLTTPYGVTTFRHEPNTQDDLNFRYIEATDPLGATEHMRFEYETAALPSTAPAGEVPTGFTAWNANLHRFNTLHWDARA